MFNHPRRSLSFAVACLIGVCLTGVMLGQIGPALEGNATEANDAFYVALNAMFEGDMAPMDAIWSHSGDVTYLPPTGETLAGWDDVRASWQAQADMRMGGVVEAQDVRVVMASPTVAVISTTEAGENPDAPGGPMQVSIRATNVYRLEADGWKMIHHHTDLLPELTGDAQE